MRQTLDASNARSNKRQMRQTLERQALEVSNARQTNARYDKRQNVKPQKRQTLDATNARTSNTRKTDTRFKRQALEATNHRIDNFMRLPSHKDFSIYSRHFRQLRLKIRLTVDYKLNSNFTARCSNQLREIQLVDNYLK